MTLSDPIYTVVTAGNQRGYSSYYTGTLASGEQFLLIPFRDDVLGLRFTPSGELLDVQSRPCTNDGDPEDTQEYSVRRRTLINAWQDEVALIPGPIRVKQFLLWDSGEPVGIARYAEWALAAIENPYSVPEDLEGRLDAFRMIADKIPNGDYAFWVGRQDYTVANNGRTVSS